MPWALIAKAFGWRAVFDIVAARPTSLSGTRTTPDGSPAPMPGSRRCWSRFTRRRGRFPERTFDHDHLHVAIHLILQAETPDPRAEIAAQLDAILGQNLGTPSPLLDWAVAGDDLAESIAPVALSVDYRPDESAFPVWPVSV